MTHTEHTPGPWAVRQSFNEGEPRSLVIYQGALTIAELDLLYDQDVRQDEANARLIAAAPDLLAILTDIVCNGVHHFTDNNGWKSMLTVSMYERAQAAIARATKGE